MALRWMGSDCGRFHKDRERGIEGRGGRGRRVQGGGKAGGRGNEKGTGNGGTREQGWGHLRDGCDDRKGQFRGSVM